MSRPFRRAALTILTGSLLTLGGATPAAARPHGPRGGHGGGKHHEGPHVVRPLGPRVVVRTRPPALRVEVRTVAPGPRHRWVGGYWAWRGRRHVWIAGAWALPPTPGWIWVEPQWIEQGGMWTFVDGHWAPAP